MELVNWFKSERENRLSGRLWGSVVMSSDQAEYFHHRAANTHWIAHSANTTRTGCLHLCLITLSEYIKTYLKTAINVVGHKFSFRFLLWNNSLFYCASLFSAFLVCLFAYSLLCSPVDCNHYLLFLLYRTRAEATGDKNSLICHYQLFPSRRKSH